MQPPLFHFLRLTATGPGATFAAPRARALERPRPRPRTRPRPRPRPDPRVGDDGDTNASPTHEDAAAASAAASAEDIAILAHASSSPAASISPPGRLAAEDAGGGDGDEVHAVALCPLPACSSSRQLSKVPQLARLNRWDSESTHFQSAAAINCSPPGVSLRPGEPPLRCAAVLEVLRPRGHSSGTGIAK